LAELLHESAKIKYLQRIRFTTSHPKDFDTNLIRAFATEDKIVNHMHLPAQSGSDRILKLMRRGYTASELIEKINALRKVRPNISISTDFIVGFPGETEKDFMDTLALSDAIGFDTSFSFIYSQRPNTPAAKLEDNISLKDKKDRLTVLQKILNESAKKISVSMLSSQQKVLVLGTAKHNDALKTGNEKIKIQLTGRTENNRIVNFFGGIDLIGQMAQVKITEVLRNSLRGELI
jgi:tRNA-2-methylthio-N6-dimethylallyladenosine synthase